MGANYGNVEGPMFTLKRADHTVDKDPPFKRYELSLGYFLNEHEVRGICKIEIQATNDLAADSAAKRISDMLFSNSGWGSAYQLREIPNATES